MNHNSRLGKRGERLAVHWLQINDFDVLQQNWRSERFELDIIAQKERVVYGIEVKTRSSNKYGWPEDNISKRKIEKMQSVMEMFVEQYAQNIELQMVLFSVFITTRKIKYEWKEIG